MPSLSFRGRITSGQDALDIGLSDLQVVDQGGRARLVAYSPTGAGLIGLGLREGSRATVTDTRIFTGTDAGIANRDIALIDRDGSDFIVMGSSGSASQGFVFNTAGEFTSRVVLEGLEAPLRGLAGLVQTENGTLYAAGTDGEIPHLRDVGTDLYREGTRELELDAPVALAHASVGSADFAIGAGRTMGGVVAYRINSQNGRLDEMSEVGTESGLGIMVPTALEVVELLGTTYVILLSSAADGGAGGALSVMTLSSSGQLVPVDHASDTLLTRFGSADSLEVVAAGGRVHVMAGGGDDGFSLFELTPDGKLVHKQSVANDGANMLDNVSALAAAEVGDELQIFSTSQTEAGVGQWTLDIGDMSAARGTGSNGGSLTGGSRDDLLNGGAGNDRIVAGAGDDVLIGGIGRDTLIGGSGRDIFVMQADDTSDVIGDFEVGLDRIDLSQFRMLYDPAQLRFEGTSSGANITWHSQTINVTRAGGGTLTLDEVFGGAFDWATHGYLPSDTPDDGDGDGGGTNGGGTPVEPPGVARNGSRNDDSITGAQGNDTLRGDDGDDTLNGGAGADSLLGGNDADDLRGDGGDDYLHGNNDNDTVRGGAGDDTVIGGPGNDSVLGEAGNDQLTGGNGNDTLIGGEGNDLFFAQAGDDYVVGGDGIDSIHLGIGSDVYEGRGGGKDVVRGLAGHDTITGGDDGDLLFGHLGLDVIDGAGGDDTIRAGIARDMISGGEGNDLLDAAPGWDTLDGGAGNDTLIGQLGNDLMTGGAGADTFVFTARSGWDTVTDFEDGIDVLSITFAGQSYASINITQVGADLRVWYGSGGIVLEDTDRSEISASDFLFS